MALKNLDLNLDYIILQGVSLAPFASKSSFFAFDSNDVDKSRY